MVRVKTLPVGAALLQVGPYLRCSDRPKQAQFAPRAESGILCKRVDRAEYTCDHLHVTTPVKASQQAKLHANIARDLDRVDVVGR